MPASTQLDPEILRWMDRVHELALTLPDLGSPDIAAWRRAERELSDAVALDHIAESVGDCRVDDVLVSDVLGGLGGRSIRMRRYRPLPGCEPQPTQLFLHGGGFAFGSADEVVNDRIIRQRAVDTGVQFFSLDYRLAPEHPFPAALEDAVLAFEWLLDNAHELAVDVDRLGVGGVSAGGGIAAGLTLRLRDLGHPVPCHQLLEVPATTMTPSGESMRLYGTGFGLEDLDRLGELYLGELHLGTRAPGHDSPGSDSPGSVSPGNDSPGSVSPGSVYASPLEHPDLSRLPRTLVMTAQFDPLRDAGELFAARLLASGTDAAFVRGDGQVHGSSPLTARLAGARRWQAVAAQELRQHLVNATIDTAVGS